MNSERAEALEDFLKRVGWADAIRAPLPGDASTRRYVRLAIGERKAMLMDQPQNAEAPTAPVGATPEARKALGYNAVARLAGADCRRFVSVAQFLRNRGLSAPDIYDADTDAGFVLIEDLGDALYADVLASGGDEDVLYNAAADVLAKLHLGAGSLDLPQGLALHPYDETALIAEVDLLTEWFLPLALGRPATDDEVAEHRALWRRALSSLDQSAPVFVHRDYHAQNLLWLPQRKGAARVGLIDFQDAVAGSRAYDLISLIEDARRDVAPALAEAATARYLSAMRAGGAALNVETFKSEMAVIAAQRNAKIVGIFARLHKRDGKTRYLALLPRVWAYLERDLEHPALDELRRWYERIVPKHMRRAIEGEAS